MEVKQVSQTIESNFSLQNGYLFKRSSLSMELSVDGHNYPVKITHESKALSDYTFHKNESLIQKSFVFYLFTKANVWYNFSSLEKMFEFVGLVYDGKSISEAILDEVRTQSNFSESELLK